MKLLREYIRELLTESIDPKIMSMIDRAEEAGFRGYVKDGYAAIYDPAIDVSDRSPGYVGHANRVAGVMWNHISTGEFGFPCSGARAVSISGSKDFGMGPLAYDLAIEASGGLMSDRSEVSSDARAVWDYYMKNRPDVIKQQLDDENDWLTPGREDNCSQDIEGTGGTAVDMYPDNPRAWVDSSLSKMYRKTGTPVMDELRKRGMLEER